LFANPKDKIYLNVSKITTNSALISWKIPKDKMKHIGALRVSLISKIASKIMKRDRVRQKYQGRGKKQTKASYYFTVFSTSGENPRTQNWSPSPVFILFYLFIYLLFIYILYFR